jgi:hypothetical protein
MCSSVGILVGSQSEELGQLGHDNPFSYTSAYKDKTIHKTKILGSILKDFIVDVIKNQLHLCGEFLMMLDERNFHCWNNYRRYYVGSSCHGWILVSSGEDAFLSGFCFVVVVVTGSSSGGKSICVSSKKDDKMVKEIKKLLHQNGILQWKRLNKIFPMVLYFILDQNCFPSSC